MMPRLHHWIMAGVIAVAVHGSSLVFFLGDRSAGAEGVGAGGLHVNYGMVGGVPGGIEVEPAEVDPVETAEVPEVETVAAAEELMAVETQTAETVEPVVEDATVTEVAAVEPLQEVAAVELVVPAASLPKSVYAEDVTPRETAAEQAAADQHEQQEASIAGTEGQSGDSSSADTGSGESVSQGGRPGAQVEYLTALMAWLERHKKYPFRARSLRQEGTATLVFTVDREGRVSNVGISISTGFKVLDKEVSAMLRRAAPLPPFPDDVTARELRLAVPVEFYLR